MNADSLAPPALRGEERGCGSADAEDVVEVTDDGAGESRKPPALYSEAIVNLFKTVCRRCCNRRGWILLGYKRGRIRGSTLKLEYL